MTEPLDLRAIETRLVARGTYYGRGDVIALLAALRSTRNALNALLHEPLAHLEAMSDNGLTAVERRALEVLRQVRDDA